MCVIIYKPSKANITKEVLRDCWADNPDSGGFMLADNGKLSIVKGFMAFKKFYKQYRKYENKYPNSNFVIHFRIATHGNIDNSNCHPFYVSKNIGFAHNGVLSCMDVLPKSDKSDTKLFCEEVLKKLPSGFLNKKEYQIILESMAKNEYSKFAFLTNDGICHIFNESAGLWRNGCWFSNGYSVLHTTQQKQMDTAKTTYQRDIVSVDGEQWYECLYCGDYLPESEMAEESGTYICSVCLEEAENDNRAYRRFW